MCSLSSLLPALFVLGFVSSVCCFQAGYPKLFPNGSVDFGPDTSKEYKSVIYTEFDDQGLGAYYSLVKSFINTVQSEPLPVDIVEKYVKDGIPSSDFAAIWEEWQSFELPVLITFGVGILFMIFLPLIGCCFCCCRCCGNCGGEMMQKKGSNTSGKRTCFTATLFFIFVFMLVSVIIVFFCNERISTSVTNAQKFSNDALSESSKFISNIKKDIKDVTETDFTAVLGLLDDQLSDDGIKKGLGDVLLANLKTPVEAPIEAVKTLATDIGNLRNALSAIKNNTDDLKTLSTTLQNELNNCKNEINNSLALCAHSTSAQDKAFCDNIDTSKLVAEADFSALDSVSTQLDEIDAVMNQDFAAKAEEGLAQFNSIPDKIVNESSSARKTVNETMHNIQGEVSNYTVNSDKLFSNLSTDLENYRAEVDSVFKDYVVPYDQYRWYFGVASTCILLLVVVLVGLGMMCGIIGYDREAMPTTRSGVSHTGGNTLITAAGFLFLIAAGAMLGTSLGFLLGFHYQKMCDPIVDDQVLEWATNGRFGELKISGNFTLDVKGLIDGCRDNQAIYKAGGLSNLDDLNLRSIFNVSQFVGDNFDQQIDDLNVNVNDTSILTPEAKKSLEDLKNSTVNTIDFDEFLNVTNQAIVAIDLETFAQTLEAVAGNLTNATVAQSFRDNAQCIRNISTTTVKDMKAKSDTLKSNVESIKLLGSKLNDTANDVLEKAEAAEAYIQTNVSADVKEATKAYGDSLLNTVTSFVDYVFSKMENSIGRCKPLGDVYDGLVTMLCKEFTYPCNGWWFAVGWCCFFAVPCIIFSVKLAKHYRRMKYEEGFDAEGGGVENYPMTTRGIGQEKKVWGNNGYVYPDSQY